MLLLTAFLACNPPFDRPVDTDTEPLYDPLVDAATPIAVQAGTCAECGGDCAYEVVDYAQRYHTVRELDYPDPPPVGGPHSYCWVEHGVYGEPVPDENWVHNLEHGDVVLLWNCPDGCPEQVTWMTGFAAEHPDRVVVTPYPEMPWRFAVVAWRFRWMGGCLDEAQVRSFYATHVDGAPESQMGPPPGECSGFIPTPS